MNLLIQAKMEVNLGGCVYQLRFRLRFHYAGQYAARFVNRNSAQGKLHGLEARATKSAGKMPETPSFAKSYGGQAL